MVWAVHCTLYLSLDTCDVPAVEVVFNNVTFRGIATVNSVTCPVKRHGIGESLGRLINMWEMCKASVFMYANSEVKLHRIGCRSLDDGRRCKQRQSANLNMAADRDVGTRADL